LGASFVGISWPNTSPLQHSNTVDKILINAVYMALLAGIILYFGLDFDSSKLSIFFWQL